MQLGATTGNHNHRVAVGFLRHLQSKKFDFQSLGKGWSWLPISPYNAQSFHALYTLFRLGYDQLKTACPLDKRKRQG